MRMPFPSRNRRARREAEENESTVTQRTVGTTTSPEDSDEEEETSIVALENILPLLPRTNPFSITLLDYVRQGTHGRMLRKRCCGSLITPMQNFHGRRGKRRPSGFARYIHRIERKIRMGRATKRALQGYRAYCETVDGEEGGRNARLLMDHFDQRPFMNRTAVVESVVDVENTLYSEISEPEETPNLTEAFEDEDFSNSKIINLKAEVQYSDDGFVRLVLLNKEHVKKVFLTKDDGSDLDSSLDDDH